MLIWELIFSFFDHNLINLSALCRLIVNKSLNFVLLIAFLIITKLSVFPNYKSCFQRLLKESKTLMQIAKKYIYWWSFKEMYRQNSKSFLTDIPEDHDYFPPSHEKESLSKFARQATFFCEYTSRTMFNSARLAVKLNEFECQFQRLRKFWIPSVILFLRHSTFQ